MYFLSNLMVLLLIVSVHFIMAPVPLMLLAPLLEISLESKQDIATGKIVELLQLFQILNVRMEAPLTILKLLVLLELITDSLMQQNH
jgi:hypothetical protein